MDRFFVPLKFNDNELWVDNDEAYHMLVVKRHKVGDKVQLFNGTGDECVAEIVEIFEGTSSRKKKAKVIITSLSVVNKEAELDITIAFSVPKGKYSDLIVQKCSELGVTRLVPLRAERSVVKSKSGSKEEKWRRIAVEASKQCGRNVVTDISDTVPFQTGVSKLVQSHNLSLILDNKESHSGIKNILKDNPCVKSVLCMIGPEGGFTSKEVAIAESHGCVAAKLTPQVLRVETAAISIAAMLIYEFSL